MAVGSYRTYGKCFGCDEDQRDYGKLNLHGFLLELCPNLKDFTIVLKYLTRPIKKNFKSE
jgi:hypothetical protein